MKNDYQVLVCGGSHRYRGQGLAAAMGFLPVSRMFLTIVSDSLCSSPAGLYRVSLERLEEKGMKSKEG